MEGIKTDLVVFEEAARETMIEFNLEDFRNSHPLLLLSILYAMEKSREYERT